MSRVLLVGSGPGGVHAAAPLVAAGHEVEMLDFGAEDRRYSPLIADQPFTTLRRTDERQHRYLLGDDFEGIALGRTRVGAQLTPPRLHVLADAPALQPVDSRSFSASLSLAKGGLGAAWSAGAFPFSAAELLPLGLGAEALSAHYEAVAERIGVSCGADDLEPFFPLGGPRMPPLEIDSNAEAVLSAYGRKRRALNRRGFFLGRTPLAVCSRRHRGRGPHGYRDLAYWADFERSIYRPQWTLEELSRYSSFTYLAGRFVESFAEDGDGVRVRATLTSGGDEIRRADALVLAAGAIGTACIVLASLRRYDVPVPILCNPYLYVPTINRGLLGRSVRDRRHSLAQLTAVLVEPEGGIAAQAQLFSYRSLLTFKLLNESPLACRESIRILRLLLPYLAILGVHHPDAPSPDKVGVLRRASTGGRDRLEIHYRTGAAEARRQREHEDRLVSCFRALGCWPLRRVRPGAGANMHYAGTLPMGGGGGELSCDQRGRLRGSRAVYVADGSVFTRLPAKGLTFTLMANADRVGTLLAAALRSS